MKPGTRGRNILLYAASEKSADIQYASGFSCPDPFIFVRTGKGRRIMVMSDLEIDRARATARAHRVLPLARFTRLARERKPTATTGDVIAEVLRELKIRGVVVPPDFDVAIADQLRSRNIGVRPLPAPFFPERQIKSTLEIGHIGKTMRATENGMSTAVSILRASRIKNGWLSYQGRRLTVERLRREINAAVFAMGAIPAHTIVAPGEQGCDPHEVGSGPIRAHTPIIIDIFPRSEKTGYYGDMTRTLVKGKAGKEVKRMYGSVQKAQRRAVAMIREGVDVRDIHGMVHGLFARDGFATGKIGGRMQGFFHGTGHGLGLEIHEPPRIGEAPATLRKGMVVTVEPGLYYSGTGGVRIEDTVLVTKDGVRNLTRFPKYLEVD